LKIFFIKKNEVLKKTMKLKFKTQSYQTAAVQAVLDCFKGQAPASTQDARYRIDPGRVRTGETIFSQEGMLGGFKTPT